MTDQPANSWTAQCYFLIGRINFLTIVGLRSLELPSSPELSLCWLNTCPAIMPFSFLWDDPLVDKFRSCSFCNPNSVWTISVQTVGKNRLRYCGSSVRGGNRLGGYQQASRCGVNERAVIVGAIYFGVRGFDNIFSQKPSKEDSPPV